MYANLEKAGSLDPGTTVIGSLGLFVVCMYVRIHIYMCVCVCCVVCVYVLCFFLLCLVSKTVYLCGQMRVH